MCFFLLLSLRVKGRGSWGEARVSQKEVEKEGVNHCFYSSRTNRKSIVQQHDKNNQNIKKSCDKKKQRKRKLTKNNCVLTSNRFALWFNHFDLLSCLSSKPILKNLARKVAMKTLPFSSYIQRINKNKIKLK